MVSYVMALSMISCSVGVLILVVVEDGLVRNCCIGRPVQIIVLILVVVEDGLVQRICSMLSAALMRLNPCCSGRWSRTMQWCNNQRSSIKS